MGELVPLRRDREPEPARGVMGCNCPIGFDPASGSARPRFIAQPGCPVHGTSTQVLVEQVSTGPRSVEITVFPVDPPHAG